MKPAVVYLCTYPPRECGIATFTKDLMWAVNRRSSALLPLVVAINENSSSLYNYPPEVVSTISADCVRDYLTVAEKINADKNIKLVSIQHEYGLFGGNWGDHLLPFLYALKKPIVTTLHAVLPKPEKFLLNLTAYICDFSRHIIVMNSLSQDILISDYGVDGSKIIVIPHGIPAVSFETSGKSQTLLGLKNRKILSTFGLLSPGKGIEYAIRALPPLVGKYPQLLYLVIGATHPNIRREEGESYRNFLHKEVKRLNLQNNVKFYNKYLTLEEIISYLKATDIYVATPIGREQSVSGTVSYALGCGRPVVSTATSYACHLINENRGRLVKFKDSNSVTKALAELINDEKLVKNLSINAYEATRPMTWPNVGYVYGNLFKEMAGLAKKENGLLPVKLDHLFRMTDAVGICHHSRYANPQKRFGYSTDDNARALIIAVKCGQLELAGRYLNFLKRSQKANGSFAYLAAADGRRDWRYEEDVQGRVLWSLGYFLAADIPNKEYYQQAKRIFDKSLQQAENLKAPRAVAFAIKGFYYLLRHHPQKAIRRLLEKLADNQITLYKQTATANWQWFEDQLTYSNSKLPESLYYAYAITKRPEYLEIANRTLEFLRQITFEKKHYSPIGQAGWYVRDKKRSYFDQQPEDAASMVETKTAAYLITGEKKHARDAYTAFQWFLGKNSLNVIIYDETSGGCCDGIGRHAVNLNQGAESTISYLLARLAIEEIWSHMKTK